MNVIRGGRWKNAQPAQEFVRVGMGGQHQRDCPLRPAPGMCSPWISVSLQHLLCDHGSPTRPGGLEPREEDRTARVADVALGVMPGPPPVAMPLADTMTFSMGVCA